MQLPCQPGPGLLGILAVELEAVRAVDRHRVDAQALQRLQDRLARAPVEGDAFLYLRGLRRVLQEHHVGERVARADDRHAALAGGAPDLVAELVDLADRLLEVLVEDLVGGHSGHRGQRRVLG